MKSIIDELKASSILTKEEIGRIQLYINKKYSSNSSKENASILSKTIYGIIDKNLVGLSEEDKKNIRKNIIRGTINRNKISKGDVFDAYIIELKENLQLKNTLIEWINKNQKNDVSQEIFDEYVRSVHNTKDTYKLASEDVKEQPKTNGIIKYYRLLKHKFNFKNTILKYKSEVLYFNSTSKKNFLCILSLLILSLYSINYLFQDSEIVGDKLKTNNNISQTYVSNIDTHDLYVKENMSNHTHLPDYFNYKSIDKDKLLEFLNTRNSMLAEEPYFSAIIMVSREFNLNPHILFAITGQEQSFVPRDHKNAEKIANNPFNVFHSWQDYNTDIYDSSRIAARTVINLSKDRPTNIDIFNWINNRYAEDKNWGRGVKAIFETLGE